MSLPAHIIDFAKLYVCGAEDHLDMTPVEYVMWRYRGGMDKEMAKKDANTMTEEELKALRQKAKEEKSGVVEVLSVRCCGP